MLIVCRVELEAVGQVGSDAIFQSLVHSLHASIGIRLIKSRADVLDAALPQEDSDSAEMNCGPLSVVIVVGIPHREKSE